MKVLTPEALFRSRGLPRTTRAINDSAYAYINRSRNHRIIDARPRPDQPDRIHVTAEMDMDPRMPSGTKQVTLTVEMDRAVYDKLPDGEPGPVRQRRRVDREVMVSEHLWPRWPRLWLVRDPGTTSRVIDGTRRMIPDHGFLRAEGIARGDKTSTKPRGGMVRVYRDKYDDCDYPDVNAAIADGWKVSTRQ